MAARRRSGPGGMAGAHVSRVRELYRRLLRLHRALPPDLKALGDQYVRDEFRRHKAVGAADAGRFLREWEMYAAALWQQAHEKSQTSAGNVRFGAPLPEEKLNDFRDEQIGQLQELMQEATKPSRQFSIAEPAEPDTQRT